MVVTLQNTPKDENDIVYQSLQRGNTLTKFKALNELGVGSLPQRIYDLKHRGIMVHDRFIFVTNRRGERVRVKEYSLSPFK